MASIFEGKRDTAERTDKLTVYPVASSRMVAFLITATPEDNDADPREEQSFFKQIFIHDVIHT